MLLFSFLFGDNGGNAERHTRLLFATHLSNILSINVLLSRAALLGATDRRAYFGLYKILCLIYPHTILIRPLNQVFNIHVRCKDIL
jgi:hypothetical protein